MKTRTRFTTASMIPVAGLLVLAGVFPAARPALAECPLPPGATPLANPPVTAQQVELGSATLKDFALGVRDQFRVLEGNTEAANLGNIAYTGCLVRQEGSAYRSGATYLVTLTPDFRVLVHAKDMFLSGRRLKAPIMLAILSSLGLERTVLEGFLSPDPETFRAAFTAYYRAISQEPDGEFDAATPTGSSELQGIPGASGHAAVYLSGYVRSPLILLAGFDLNESHLETEEIDYGNPTVTAKDVVDRETLKAFVTEAAKFISDVIDTGLLTELTRARIALRDPTGPWRHGSVYLYVLDRINNSIILHGAFPNRFEMRPLVATVRDAVTGKLVLPQVIEAAKSNPEGGFVEYYFDDPNDDTDRLDIPKVGYAREVTGQIRGAEGFVVPFNVIVGSGFYGNAPDPVSTGPTTVVEATVLGDAVEGLDVAFSRAIAGRQSDYTWSAVTDAAGLFSLTISSGDGVSGYYRARATNSDGEVVGRWSSIPLNGNQRQVLELTLGGGARVVRVHSLSSSSPEAAAKPAFATQAVPEASGLGPNSPNPFNSTTLITYHLSRPGPAKLVIYNVLGQPVRTLVDETRGAGTYRVKWDARDEGGALLSTGVYIARLSFPGGAHTQRLLYLK